MILCVVTRIVNKNKGSVWETQVWINIRNVTLGASFRYSELALVKMSRTVAFGRDILNAPDVDIEDYCCKTIHRFHNRLYNHGEGPY